MNLQSRTGIGPHGEPRVAVFSKCMKYRYSLEIGNTKKNDQTKGVMILFGMNPSTADHEVNDRTIRRAVGWMWDWNHHFLLVLNVFAIRETHSKKLPQYEDIIGPDNDEVIRRCLLKFKAHESTKVVCGWGDAGHRDGRGLEVYRMIKNAGHKPLCFGTNFGGGPVHPLYQPANAKLKPYVLDGA